MAIKESPTLRYIVQSSRQAEKEDYNSGRWVPSKVTTITSAETWGSTDASLSFTIIDMSVPRKENSNLFSFLFLVTMVAKSSQLTCQDDFRCPGTVWLLQLFFLMCLCYLHFLCRSWKGIYVPTRSSCQAYYFILTSEVLKECNFATQV